METSITEIARLANVSTTTVSRALNGHGYVSEETKARILQIAGELNYRPKQYRKRRVSAASGVIGVIVPDLGNAYFAEIIQGIENEAGPKGYDLFICDSGEDPGREARCISALRSRNVCGLIITIASDVAKYNAEYLQTLNDTEIPVVLVDRYLRSPGLDSVTFDDYGGAYSAIQAFIDNGHKDIAILCGPTTSCTGLNRLNGYLDAIKNNDLPIKEEYIMYGDFRIESGHELTKKLLASQKDVTAIFPCNQRMTIGCLSALNEAGLKVPDDIAVIAFGKADAYSLFPTPISHVRLPVPPLGEESARLLLNKLEMGRKHKKLPSKQSTFATECYLCGSEVYPKNRR